MRAVELTRRPLAHNQSAMGTDPTPSVTALQDPAAITHYHAHVYYDAATRERAALLRERVAAAFPDAVLGRWHDKPVGPHPISMYQIAFARELFPAFLPWLMLNRDGLNVLVHPETGDNYVDHSAHAAWLGDKLKLRLDVFGPRG
jgi:aromatic ring-cleaving dioxygenase